MEYGSWEWRGMMSEYDIHSQRQAIDGIAQFADNFMRAFRDHIIREAR